jgi:hypothetical protein
MGRAALFLCLALAFGAPAQAQDAAPSAAPPVRFLSRADFWFEWAKAVSSDDRFSWDGHIGVDVDVLDWGRGRVTFVADYEAVLGAERRGFDLNHGNYILESAVTFRRRDVDISGVFHHVSRHLSDRSNEPAISWNTYGVRVETVARRGRSSVSTRYQAAVAVQQAFVDYTWTTDVRFGVHHALTDRVGLIASAEGGFVGVDRLRFDRGRQCGAAMEGGVRLIGERASLDVFAGYERRVDGFPTERLRVRMFTVGFRLRPR